MLSAGTWGEFGRFRRELGSESYDCVIDSQGLLKSALITALAHGPKHGFDRDSTREPFAARFYGTRHAIPIGLHAVERNRRLAAKALGYALEGACDYGLRAATDSPAATQPPASSPYALLLTMTSREDKLWPEAHWRLLGSELEARGIQCLLPWGTDAEKLRCERIAAAVRGAVVPRRMMLGELARMAGRAHCVVGVDTGLTHLAVALGVAVVGLYGGSDPALTGLYSGGAGGAARARNLGAAGMTPSAAEALAALKSLGALA